jgi:hypothetical protein
MYLCCRVIGNGKENFTCFRQLKIKVTIVKLPFEEWIIQKQYGKSVSDLFDEAFTCYRNAAYRASLMFSYLGFMTILKETIIRSAKPGAIAQGRWDHIIRQLQNEDAWEKTVFEEITNSSAPIFNINENIRQQVKYWKDRRNDCAHSKANNIESFHTESFWSFVKSNLLKISIEGGMANLLNKFDKHFDTTYTPPDEDVSPLIREIEDTVEPTRLTDFWNELYGRIDYIGFSYFGETDFTKVVKNVFEICSENIRDNIADYLKASKFDVYIIYYYPETINQIKYSEEEVRQIWRNRIWENRSTAFSIYGTLLRNCLIPRNQIGEANLHIIAHAVDYAPKDVQTHLALAGNGFGDALFQVAFVQDRLKDWYNFVNPHADMIAYYIKNYPLKDETVEIICEMYTRTRYSHWLGERLVNIFADLPQKKAEFHDIANRKGYTIPGELS